MMNFCNAVPLTFSLVKAKIVCIKSLPTSLVWLLILFASSLEPDQAPRNVGPVFGLKLFIYAGAQWLSGRVLLLRLRGHWFKSHQRYCVVSIGRYFIPCLVLIKKNSVMSGHFLGLTNMVKPRKCPDMTVMFLIGM